MINTHPMKNTFIMDNRSDAITAMITVIISAHPPVSTAGTTIAVTTAAGTALSPASTRGEWFQSATG